MGACTVAVETPPLDVTIKGLPKGVAKHGTDSEGRFVWLKITGPASYDTGGSAVALTGTPLKSVTHAYHFASGKSDDSAHDVCFPSATLTTGASPKLKVYSGYSGGLTEGSAASNYSVRTWYFKVYGVPR